MRTLILFRWVAIAGQTATVLVTGVLLKLPIPLAPCITLIAVAAFFNLALMVSPAARRSAQPWELTGQLALDILQLAGLLYLTGGVANPFLLFLVGAVTLGAGYLRAGPALFLAGLAILVCIVLTFVSRPVPWLVASGLNPPFISRVARALGVILAIAFSGLAAAWSAAESARAGLALHVTETVLSREQRLSALGGLAAAAAHELGTPLATISVVARELAREAPEGSLRDDAWLLVEQAQRCRDILHRLTQAPDAGDDLHERMSLLQLVREVVAPYVGKTQVRVEALVAGPPGESTPDVWRRPEILHALSSIVENAFDFANAEILVTARFDGHNIALEVRDDGPGFAPDVLARLGEPYVTSRPGAEGSRTSHTGMGLGFFIAKTLLERTGAQLDFRNGRGGGALVRARWARSRIEARETLVEGLESSGGTAT